MKPFAIKRRQFLATMAAAGISPLVFATSMSSQNRVNSTPELWVSAQGNTPDKYSLGWVQPSSQFSNQSISGAVSSGFRGHGVAFHPAKVNKVIMFSRRPGTLGIEVDMKSGKVEHQFESLPGMHLSGHGCFNQDGSLLLVSETESATGKGKITVLDSTDFKRLRQFDSHGIGPHEIKLMPDGKTLVVANGGLHQSIQNGQEILNLDTMHSSLSYIDIQSGELISEHCVPESKASIRHLDLTPDGTVAIAMQVQRAAMGAPDIVPLGAIHKPGKDIELLVEPDLLISQMNDYMGSVAVNSKYRIAGFSSPRGNLVAFWNLDTHKLSGYHAFHDVCGIGVTSDQTRFVLTNSLGQLRQIDAGNLQEIVSNRMQFQNMQWDNHLVIIPRHTV